MPTDTVDKPLVIARGVRDNRFEAERRLRRDIPATLLRVRGSEKTYSHMQTVTDLGTVCTMDHWYLCGSFLRRRVQLWQPFSEEPLPIPLSFWVRDDEQIAYLTEKEQKPKQLCTQLAPVEFMDRESIELLHRALQRL